VWHRARGADEPDLGIRRGQSLHAQRDRRARSLAHGIARGPLSIGGRELDALQQGGVVGMRIDFLSAGLAPLRDAGFPRLLARLAERNLVLDPQGEADQWTRIVRSLRAHPCASSSTALGDRSPMPASTHRGSVRCPT
jgi:hypothetical protein